MVGPAPQAQMIAREVKQRHASSWRGGAAEAEAETVAAAAAAAVNARVVIPYFTTVAGKGTDRLCSNLPDDP